MTERIVPILLAGGFGTRLWPLSRRSFPKQFADFGAQGSLFQQTAQRLAGEGFAPPIVLTNDQFRFVVLEQLSAVGIDAGAVLVEPASRNTAAPILAAAIAAQRAEPDALMLVCPSDHVVGDPDLFRGAVARAAPAARDGKILTFGVVPQWAETGYGYLELSDAADRGAEAPVPLQTFVEKPDAAAAQAMLDGGRHLWNAGIFLLTARTLIAAFERHAPEILAGVTAAVDGAARDLGFLRLDAGPWSGLPDISIDYAVMEKVDNLMVQPVAFRWSDLGGWAAVWREGPPDAAGVVTHGEALAMACSDTLLRSEAPGQQLVGIGLDNIVAVAMPDAVLVARKDRAQEVKAAVAALKERGVRQASEFPRDYRPWGWYESLVMGDRFQVKRIVVHPQGRLSLQSHHHRAEHWVVVSGTAQVTIGEEVRLLTENESVYVPVGAVHRLENPGRINVVLIEVQTGAYLGEDDITRYEDMYSRI